MLSAMGVSSDGEWVDVVVDREGAEAGADFVDDFLAGDVALDGDVDGGAAAAGRGGMPAPWPPVVRRRPAVPPPGALTPGIASIAAAAFRNAATTDANPSSSPSEKFVVSSLPALNICGSYFFRTLMILLLHPGVLARVFVQRRLDVDELALELATDERPVRFPCGLLGGGAV